LRADLVKKRLDVVPDVVCAGLRVSDEGVAGAAGVAGGVRAEEALHELARLVGERFQLVRQTTARFLPSLGCKQQPQGETYRPTGQSTQNSGPGRAATDRLFHGKKMLCNDKERDGRVI